MGAAVDQRERTLGAGGAVRAGPERTLGAAGGGGPGDGQVNEGC